MKSRILSVIAGLAALPQIAFAHCPLCVAATGSAVATARFFGVSDSITGLFVGIFVSSTAIWLNNILKKRNSGKEYMALQKEIIILVSVVSTFLTFYLSGLVFSLEDKLIIGASAGVVMPLLSSVFHKALKSYNNNKSFIPFQSILLMFATALISAAGFYATGFV